MIYFLALIGCVVDIVFIAHDNKKKDGLSIILKTLASCFFVCISAIIMVQKKYDIRTVLLTLGLFADLIGDLVLILRNINTKHKDLIFVVGTLFFFIGHFLLFGMLYIVNPSFLLKSFLVTLIFLATFGLAFLKRLDTKRNILIFGAVYFYVIFYVLFYALFIFAESPSLFMGIFLFGYFLFVVSDVILSAQKYDPRISKIAVFQIVYRVSYYISQIIISYSIFYL